ncbi:hypothetical protein [Streptomyces genisteinicus]|uniref:ATP-binding protein n=1 Tax=Streptomyces genisteinicus TaxID=2768068 RepID=A0A7H0HWL7_9ACTN|nr:hypothetical protein [Streptomyces genisteinicus]QNP64933.1 hypothetical protein IAG43_19800 [Streptomyces genisteinicus]
MARHAAPSPRRGTLLRAGLTVAAAGAALGAGAASAQAAPAPVGAESVLGAVPLGAATGLAANSVAGVGELKSLQLHPLANTGVDPLDNAVGTQVADFQPVSTALVTDNITRGQALEDLPVAGPVAQGLLP